jgi:NitT/TauT family transport system ATP-binding protein
MVEANNIAFGYGDSGAKIIDDISFIANKGEFITLMGPSGCGKSTLLRIIAGLVKPSAGKIYYLNKQVTAPTLGMSFVFQDFALLPWLTNIDNIKLGLSLVNITDAEKTKKAEELIDRFGLNGFEDYYPNVLSGGMKQRVGIARAIVSEPQVLLMDEPFSALDELTANTLRSDIIYMLESKDISVNSIIMVSHNVEEAVELSDKVIVLSNKPTVVKEIVSIKSRRPRSKKSDEFLRLVDHIYAVLAR